MLERLVIDHIALCWLRLQMVEQLHVAKTSHDFWPSWGDFWDRRLSATQRRFLRAVETLARLRKLTPAGVQVETGDKQVNVSTPPG